MKPGPLNACSAARLVSSAAIVTAALLLAGCGGAGKEHGPSSSPSGQGERTKAPGNATAGHPAHKRSSERQAGSATSGAPTDPFTSGAGHEGAAVAASVRGYVAAIDRHDGSAVCAILAPGALRGFSLPERRGGCAQSVSASLGHTEPGGPVWRRSRIRSLDRIDLDSSDPRLARARVTVVHLFGGGREPSIEDDLIYLRYVAGRWLVAKPSSTFYRAVGARTVPIRALTPP
jgi:hypothetical protein